MTVWLKALAGYLRGGHAVGRALVLADWYPLARSLYLHGALSSGLLHALRAPKTRDELVAELAVGREVLLDGLLAEGLSWRVIALRHGRYRLRGSRSRALVADNGDAYAALLHESLEYHASAYGTAGRKLRGDPLGDYLEEFGEVIARSSRMIEPPTRAFLNRALRTVRPSSVVDIGCGSGTYLRHVAEYSDEVRATGIERSEDASRLAEANLRSWGVSDRCRVVSADVLELPVENHYDLALLFHNIYYFEPEVRPQLLQAIRRMLAPDGALAIVTYFKGKSRIATHFDMVLRSTAGNTPLPTLEETLTLLRENGFEVDRPVRLIPRESLYGILAR